MQTAMASKRQTAANRSNAELSTGPRSPEGKLRSSQNALVHGLTAKQPLLPGEDPIEFEAFRDAVQDDLKPEGTVQKAVVASIVVLLWRMRRIPVLEAAFARVAADMTQVGIREGRAARYLSGGDENQVDHYRNAFAIGAMLSAVLSRDLLPKLNRYERSLHGQLLTMLKEFREMQKHGAKRAISK